jgi:hypothetical protein
MLHHEMPHVSSSHSSSLQSPHHPEIEKDDDWQPTIRALRSAYRECNGQEPDFTNYAKVQEEPVFIETLDYIFHSPHWSVQSVTQLPDRDSLSGPLPNHSEPSDHLLLSATMEVLPST